MALLLETGKFVTLLGGAPTQFGPVLQSLKRAPILVAADGGANLALSNGRSPDLVIGDMDSISDTARSDINADNFHYIADQDSTDFEKCLSQISAPLILAHGFLGARLDHSLAAFHALTRFERTRCILIDETDICFLAPAALSLDLEPGTRVSLFPMAAVSGTSEGLRWPIEGLNFSPATKIGTSNEATGPVQLRFEGPSMLVILPRDSLDQAIDGLVSGCEDF